MPRCVLVLLLAACSGPIAAIDAGTDAQISDAGRDAGRIDGGPLPGPVFDTGATWQAPPLDCPDGIARRDGRDLGAQRRFALSVLHYNIQYVAGGLDNFRVGRTELFDGWTDDRVQDAIVTESLVPVLDLLDAHPTWTLSLEMQGYFVEVLLARHRAVAQHLSDLVRAGQVELISFHYSDQLFLAYPRHHIELSHALAVDVLADACVAPSAPVFTQEGQFGVGMSQLLGAESIVMIPKNLFSHFHGDVPVAPYYDNAGAPIVVAGRGVSDPPSGFETQWVYMDDAELLATDRASPYFPTTFVAMPQAVADFESGLEALEASGYVIAGIGDYVATLRSAGVTPAPLPAVLDGTWQPDDTGNLARWMGDGGAFIADERDNAILTGNSRAGHMVLAAEVVLGAMPDGAAELERAWRDLFLGEVSDTTGWNPIPNEVIYGMWHQNAASDRARALAIASAAAMGRKPPFVVHTSDGTIGDPSAEPVLEAVASPPFVIDTSVSTRPVTATWQRYAAEPDHYVVTIDVPAALGDVRIAMPWTLDVVRFTPALLDGTLVDVPLADLAFTSTAIAIASGPFALADDLWIALDTAEMNLAAHLDPALHTLSFYDATQPATQATRWSFHVVVGSAARALEVADRLNLHPDVLIE